MFLFNIIEGKRCVLCYFVEFHKHSVTFYDILLDTMCLAGAQVQAGLHEVSTWSKNVRPFSSSYPRYYRKLFKVLLGTVQVLMGTVQKYYWELSKSTLKNLILFFMVLSKYGQILRPKPLSKPILGTFSKMSGKHQIKAF